MPRITPIPARRLRRLFELAGFKCVRTEGDHYVYTKKGVIRPIVIPDWPEVPVFVIKKQLAFSRNQPRRIFQALGEGKINSYRENHPF